MPVYEIEHPKTKQKIRLEGDGVPSDADIKEAFSRVGKSYTAQETERMRRDFVAKEGTLATRAKEALPSRKQVADFARPALEGVGAGLGAVGGAALGAGVASPLLGVAGAATGYASGKYLADAIEGAPQSAPQTLKDLGTGAMYEMGGQGAGVLLAGAAKQAPAALNALRNPVQTRAEGKARQVLSSLKDLAPQEAANAAKAETLTSKLGVKLTPAQMTGKPTTAAMEQGLATADPAFAATLNAQDAAAKQAALSRIRQGVGKGQHLPNAPDLANVGHNITAKIGATLKPIKAAEREMWAQVPDYPIPTTNFDSAADAIRATPMEADTEAAVMKILDFAKKMPKTTKGLQSIERTIGDKMQSSDANVRRILGDLKAALGEDFNAMGAAADSGDIALHQGAVIFPAKLQSEREALTARITRDMQAAESAPDIPSVVNALKEAGDPPNQWMRQMGETEKAYQSRMLGRYNTLIGDTPPMLSAEPPASVVDAQKRIAQIDDILANQQPAEDVASRYKQAKDFSRTQKFDRFGRGAVSRVLQKGNEASGLRVTDENVGRQFFTPSGAAGLVKAVGPNAAKEQMKPFVVADIMKSAAPDGATFNVQRGVNYIQKNRATLERLGLVDDARQLVKDQIPAELERILAKRAPDAATGSQFFTAQDMRGILQKYGNTIKQLYGQETLQAFRDYNSLMTMIERKNVVPRGGNSNTAEKAMNLANLMIKDSVGPAKKLTDGLLGAIMKGAGVGGGATFAVGHFSPKVAAVGAGLNAGRQMLSNADSQVSKAFVKILQDATTNPQTAKDLMQLRRTGKVPATLQTVIDSHLIGATAAGAAD